MPHPSDDRDARLEARLALYAQYAALVGDEVAAAWSAVPGQAGPLTRELAAERASLAERYAALRDEAAAMPGGFEGVLAGAMTEIEHQALVDRALHDRLAQLQASGWIASPAARRGALLAGAVDPESTPDGSAEEARAALDSLFPELGGALVTARSDGLGGTAGRFPGVVAGADAEDYAVAGSGPPPVASGRVDVRF